MKLTTCRLNASVPVGYIDVADVVVCVEGDVAGGAVRRLVAAGGGQQLA